MLSELFSEHPEWDHEKKYSPKLLRIYFEDEVGCMHKIPNNSSLGNALMHSKLVVAKSLFPQQLSTNIKSLI